MKVFIIWLIGVIIWNFGYPGASPIEGCISCNSFILCACTENIYKKLIIHQKNKYF